MRAQAIRQYLDLIKFSHTLFALPFALLGAALAAHGRDGWHGRIQDWVGILLCMATARSAAMAFNRLADRHYDALNPRTAGRHLPAGLMSVRSVAVFTFVLFAGFCRLDAPVPAQPLAVVPLRSGACSGSWVIPTASVSPAWPISGWAFRSPSPRSRPGSPCAATWNGRRSCSALAVLLWVSGFDIIYACQDVDFDRKAGTCAAFPRRLEFAAHSGSRPPAMP